MKQNIVNKYSVPVPRYTSYPPANFFSPAYTTEQHRHAVVESNNREPSHISIYIHLPFCFQMCYYCGCNAFLLTDRTTAAKYVEAVKKEMQMIFPMLSKDRKVSQIHYGGGTPTSYSFTVLKEINDLIFNEFDCIENPEIAIECHPGYMTEEYWATLPEIGFNRISIGVQDFNREVLKASRRKPSRLEIGEIIVRLHRQKASVNLDFIYGLPLQTEASFAETIREAIDLKPERIVTFSYAHVPWVNPLQKKLEEVGLPTVTEKEKLFHTASGLLQEAGYRPIGLDHFVLPEDELYTAVQEKTLHRNFQGYCTRRTTGQVYAFGVTGISQLAASYSQNTKDIPTYISQIEKEELPVLKGYALNPEEQITREVISSLMCNNYVSWQEIATSFRTTPEKVKATLNYDEKNLTELEEDGLIDRDEESIRVRPEATPFVRNVAASLDKLMLHTDKQFSKPM